MNLDVSVVAPRVLKGMLGFVLRLATVNYAEILECGGQRGYPIKLVRLASTLWTN